MKKHALLAAFMILVPAEIMATDLNIGGTTLLQYEQRAVPGFAKQQFAPLTQYLSGDAEKLWDGNLSFHMYGWGRADLADQSAPDGATDGTLSYGYLRYRFPKANAEIKAGRLFYFESGTIEQLDGIAARADILPKLKGLALSLYAGKPVKNYAAIDNKGDLITGGRISYRIPAFSEIGVSALNETGSLSRSYDSASATSSETSSYRRLIGYDLLLTPFRTIDLAGRSTYDAPAGEWSEHRYKLTARPIQRITATADYAAIKFQGAFANAGIPSLFKPDVNDDLTAAGTTISWTLVKNVEVTADYRHYNRKSKGESDRFGGETRVTLLEGILLSGAGIHRLAAARGIDSYTELRGYGIYDAKRWSASIDAIADIYDDPIYAGTDRVAYELAASAGYKIDQNLLLSTDISAVKNPAFGNELKGLVRLTFNYAISSNKGGGK